MLRFISALVFALCAVTPAHAQDSARLQDGLQGLLNNSRDRYGFPVATAAVALPDVRVGAPVPSFATNCQRVWVPRWKSMPMQLSTAARAVVEL